ncbi:tetratricopeptide repeat protein [Sulfitobacter guttiformis]|uniref:Tetratricopeptide repeat protein n=1 Tax=Sulfitobacter guttiformis TaxID=74349 RepID=A0A420DPX7_9RHOB|nr:tetratricopeptide repeat protein [Sulfitobacter guttiformis]KIN73750.1 TPR domain protein [Sulfitobacter guttiformis KCTC 32187]RKE96384.1 tetratricopeptide repeat protein [Sulfitobacter guttiformis]
MRNFLTSVSIAALGIALSIGAPAPVSAETLAGSYLAGRSASVRNDFGIAAKYYGSALARDPSNVELMESAALSYLALGDISKALPLAKAIIDAGQRSHVAQMVTTAGLIDDGDFVALAAHEAGTDGISPWVDGLVKGWALIGSDDVSGALAQFDSIEADAGMRGIVQFHKALALATVGRYADAEALFASEAPGSAARTRRGVIARVEILSQLGRNEDAVQVIASTFSGATDPELDILIANLETGAQLPFTHAPTARAGLSEVFFTFAALLRAEQASDYYTLLYARIARHLRPDHVDALLLTAELLEQLGQYELAIEEYRAVDADDPAFHVAELGRAAGLRRLDKVDQAIEVLEQLTRSHGNLAVVHATLGDIFRAQDQDQAAIAAYTKAVDLTDKGDDRAWFLYFSRGIAYSQDGDNVSAEADFRAALAINPDQPQVLNYLGYSLVEEQRKLDEALGMIERAVAASPDSGYIVDSLGWVYYRLGRYDEAVIQMERAVELEAVDPVVNDHLGDVYWAVGRKREAQFQWKRALSFVEFSTMDTEAEPDRIRRKLEVGLDVVLVEEGAEPLKVANDN